jgi:hydroxyacylglutathione hydrolase
VFICTHLWLKAHFDFLRSSMQIIQNNGGIAATNAFLIADESIGKAVIFDAPNDTVAPLLIEAHRRGWDVIGLWLTHGHFDHVADHERVTSQYPKAKVLMHRLDERMLVSPTAGGFPLPFVIPPRRADEYVEDNQELAIGNIRVRVMHTPGHAPGHVMYYLPDFATLVGGDLIIMGAVGRTDIPGADEAKLLQSVRRVMELPDETKLLPGHGRTETLGDVRRKNRFVQAALSGAERFS